MDEPVRTIPAVRSTQGCWTCRLRRKKCDEVRPECNRCVSVNVTCCYGPKPRWMENDVRAKAELEKIKRIVGASASRKRAAFREKTRVTINSTESLSPHFPQTPENEFRNGSHDLPSLPAISSLLSYHPRGSQSPGEISETKAFPYPKWAEDHEASLMMHYLDNVFFIQFRFHTPSISTGGRGWLLSLLTRTKPLYHAALSLSAFHQQSVLCIGQEGSQTQTNTLQELERHHNLTLQELQVFIHAHSSNGNALGIFGGNIQILACMVQLISFELFNGGTSNWQVHLKAASALVLALHGIPEANKRDHPAFQREPRSTHYFPLLERPSPNGPLSSEHAALNFLTGAIIWFDILACVSLDSKPHLSEHQSELLSTTAGLPYQEPPTGTKIELDTIMGCQNWCMIIISEIAQLGKEKDNTNIQSEQLTTREHDIRHRLELNTSQVRKQLDEIRVHYNGPPPSSSPEIYNRHAVYVVTYIFACAAIIYLQNIISSFCHPSLLEQTISALKLIPDPRMIRGLLWPLCIAGCMAQTEPDRAFFKDLATTAISDSRTFGNSGKALEILEMAWELQEQSGGKEPVDCRVAIRRMGSCVLLV